MKSPSVGTIEIYQNKIWKKTCTTNWDKKETELTCKTFGYYEEDGKNRTSERVNSTTSTNHRANNNCTMLTRCLNDDNHYNFQPCKVPVQLTGTSIPYGGRVEVFYRGKWGRICRDEWEIEDARVVCHQLGYKDALAVFTGSDVATGIGPVVMSKVKCWGNESELTFCDREDGNIAGDCQNDEGAQVLCQPEGNQTVLKNEEIEMTIGNEETIRCDLEKGDVYVGWFNSTGFDLGLTKEGIVSSSRGGKLVIKNVEPSDGATYECRGRNFTRFYTLYVNARITDAPERQDLVEGKPGVLRCIAEGEPSPLFVWKKDGKILDAQRFKELPDGRLNVTTVDGSDNGAYQCIVSQNKGTKRTTKTTRDITVVVVIPPEIELSGTRRRKHQGKNATLTCTIKEGSPKPTIEWYFKGKLIGNDETLVLNSVTKRDHEGDYTCNATNSGGSSVGTTYLSIDIPAQITIPLQNKTLPVDSTLELNCTVDGDPDPLIVWKKNGSQEIPKAKLSNDNRTLTIDKTGLSDTGLYECSVSNSAGKEKSSAWIEVAVPPHIEVSPVNKTCKQGENVMLHCNASGIPQPRISWHFNNKNISLTEDAEILANGSLILYRVGNNEKYEGMYTCSATNSGGSVAAGATLVVDVPPKVSQHLQNKSVPVNTTFAMTCTVGADPPAHVYWTKDGAAISNHIQLSSDNATISIDQVALADQGRYTCYVSNRAGTAHSVFWIDITVPLQIYVPPENQTVVEGQTANFTCKASGVPQPEILWTFNGKRDLPPGVGTIRVEEGTMLQVPHATKDSEGSYTCTAQNKQDTTSASAKLIVLEKPTAKILPNPHPPLMIGDMLSLECVVNHNDIVKIQWRKDGATEIPRAHIEPPYKTLVIESVEIADSGRYSCEVQDQAGEASAFVDIQVRESVSNLQWYIIGGSIAGVILLVAVAGCWYICVRRKEAADIHNEPPEIEMGQLQAQDTSLPWEVPLNLIHFERFIGRGAFGEVWKGLILKPEGELGNTQVAIKCISRTSEIEGKEALMKEIRLAKEFAESEQPNIVKFMGCVTIPDQPMLFLEYASYGDLLGYMRKSRGVEDPYHAGERTGDKLTTYDLVMSAKDVASGMVFLHSHGIIHRDLAARNILVADGKVCKVADFGLAFQTHKYSTGTARKGRFPIKWTAPEILFENYEVVSTKCDVWSFGVLLYEIFTIGGIPYPGWTEQQTVHALCNQYRMPKPEHIDQSMYNVMLRCWNESPVFRPAFENLRQRMQQYLEENAYLELVNLSKYDQVKYSVVEDLPCKGNQNEATAGTSGKKGKRALKWSSVRF